jgi:hypothetical protein
MSEMASGTSDPLRTHLIRLRAILLVVDHNAYPRRPPVLA